MLDDTEKHFKKKPNKPWVLEVKIVWPESGQYMAGRTSHWKFRYASEKSAKQAEPLQVERWLKYKDLVVSSRIYKK